MPEFTCQFSNEHFGDMESTLEADTMEEAADLFLRQVSKRYPLCSCCPWNVTVRNLTSSVPVEFWGKKTVAFDVVIGGKKPPVTEASQAETPKETPKTVVGHVWHRCAGELPGEGQPVLVYNRGQFDVLFLVTHGEGQETRSYWYPGGSGVSIYDLWTELPSYEAMKGIAG